MDRIVPSEGIDVGSIPAGRTNGKLEFSRAGRVGETVGDQFHFVSTLTLVKWEYPCGVSQDGTGKIALFVVGAEELAQGLPRLDALDGFAEDFAYRDDLDFIRELPVG